MHLLFKEIGRIWTLQMSFWEGLGGVGGGLRERESKKKVFGT